MSVIESYSFGRMVIAGESFSQDVIIFPDSRILCPWWRKEGHRLHISDIESLIGSGPEIIVAGIGSSGLMQPTHEVIEYLEQRKIEFVAQRTGEAIETYNRLTGSRKTGGCFHLTC